MTSPARNAPKASDAPAAAVPRAVSVPTRMTAMRNSSRLRVLRMTVRTRGTTVRASTNTLMTTSTALPSARSSAPAPPPDRPARNGSTSIMGTTHRSWKISTPVASRPWRVDLALVREALEHDRGTGERDEEPQEDGHSPVGAQGHGQETREHDGERYLRAAASDHLPPHLTQATQGELDPDGKEQEDDTHFREALHLVRVGNQAERVGAEQHARDDEPREGGELDTVEYQNDE